jgi:SulP family sulfate permease
MRRSPGCSRCSWRGSWSSASSRASIVTRLLSSPVLTGYLAGSGIVIAISQLPKVTGISTDKRYPQVVGGLVRSAETAEPWAIAIGIATVLVVVALARFAGKLPAALIAMALATAEWPAWVMLLEYGCVATAGRFRLGVSQRSACGRSFPPRAGGKYRALIYASSFLTAQALAVRDREAIRPNREFLALSGAASRPGSSTAFRRTGATRAALPPPPAARSQGPDWSRLFSS